MAMLTKNSDNVAMRISIIVTVITNVRLMRQHQFVATMDSIYVRSGAAE